MNTSVWRAAGMRPLLIMSFLGFCGYAALLPVAPLWAVHGGADEAGSGLVNGVFMALTVLTQLVVPTALRRFGWGPVMAAGMLLLGVPSLFHLLSDELWVILGLAVVRGMGFGVLTVTGSAVVADLVPAGQRGRAVGVYGLAIASTQVFLLPAAPWLADNAGYWVVFALGALPVLGAPAAPTLARVLHGQPGPEDTGERPPYVRLIRPMVLLLAVTLAGGALITFTAQMSSSSTLTVVGLMVFSLMAAASRWQVGALADRAGAHRFVWPLVVLSAVGMLVIAWSVRDQAATAALALLVGMAIVGTCYGGLQNLTMLITFSAVTRRHFSQASAVWNIGFDAGTGLGSVVVGLVAAGSSFSTALVVVAGTCLATLPLALVRSRPQRSPADGRSG
ncbi:MFS transporter [Ornithinimicrobium murale]|uniref:MFS transporter n=1 Tax=Ornithinimicrobium murale TaxID=1050153 RepID=UPI001EDD662C|nr:MFS transporter [Ornithinimicrobium murale]